MTLINLTMTLSVAMFLLQLCGIRVTGFVVEETLLFSRSKAALPSSTETLMLSSGNLIQQRKRELSSRHKINSLVISPTPFTKASRYFAPKQQRELAHFHHPQNINIENGSTARSGSISGTTKFSQIRDRLRGILRRNNRNDNANILKSTNNRKRNLRYRRMWLVFASLTLSLLVRPTVALAMGAMGGGGSGAPRAPLAKNEQLSLCGLFFFLFGGLALLHAAEIAITTLYPWKVKEFAEEEEKLGQRGTFKILNEDITRVLTTILVASTTCSIFATTVFTHLVAGVFGNSGEKYGALALTALTLFFVELLPKSIGVTNAESVARIMVPPINIMTMFVSPVGVSLSWLAKKTLSLIGLQGKDNSGITDSQLRLIVTGAKDSGTIDLGEQEMIQGVLGLQNQRVKEIMKPRVEIIAVPKDMSVASVLGVVRESGYSRIPVYDGEIDNIVGIVLAKNVLDFFVRGVLVDEDVIKKIRENLGSSNNNNNNNQHQKDTDDDEQLPISSEQSSSESPIEQDSPPQLYTNENMPTVQTPKGKENYVKPLTGFELARRMEKSISEAELIENCYFVPETANGWSVLQEMRRRRVHMAIVVDEYGGTEGLVSLEDIVEEVVGEIYDEDDEEEYDFSEDSITLQDDGSFIIRGDADLEDCDTILNLKLDEEEALKVFATLSGFLCMCAGEIPQVGDFVMIRGWCFEIMNADDKKILSVKVERLVGAYENEPTDDDDNPIRGFLKRNLGNDEENGDIENDVKEDPAIALNRETAREVERMVDSGSEKRLQLASELEGKKDSRE
jgi:CBS domain containing-hemolysin-like protein